MTGAVVVERAQERSAGKDLAKRPMPSQVEAELAGLAAALPAVEPAWPPVPGERQLLFVCCDSAYLRRHGLAFARALDANAPGSHLHIHLINPDDGARASLAGLALARTTLSQSRERVDFSARSDEYRRTYCASIRFLRQYQLLRASGRAVMAFDVDALIRGRLDGLWETLEQGGYDCAVHTRFRTWKRREKFLLSAFYVAPSAAGRDLLAALSLRIATRLLRGEGPWYMDQVALYDCYRERRRAGLPLRLYHLPKALSDWDFHKHAAIWVAKGWRKDESEVFVAHQDAYRTTGERLARGPAMVAGRPRIGLVLPRLDCAFNRPRGFKGLVSRLEGIGTETRRLRSHWTDFAQGMTKACRDRGFETIQTSLPLWQLTPEWVAGMGVDLALLPHRQHYHFPSPPCRTLFYMQTVQPWLFSLDPLGWGPAGSRYPCDDRAGDPESGTFERYRALLVERNGSKFGQPPRQARAALVAGGEIPEGRYIFFPCQRLSDASTRLFCDLDPVELVRRLADWARARGIPIVFKAHPTNRASARPLRRAAGSGAVYWSKASIHDLVAHSAAVYLVNSGVGFEALLQDKPVVTFGRAEYDAVTIHGRPEALDAAWAAVERADPQQRLTAYRRFVDWYCRHHCVDLSDSAAAGRRLAALVEQWVVDGSGMTALPGRRPDRQVIRGVS